MGIPADSLTPSLRQSPQPLQAGAPSFRPPRPFRRRLPALPPPLPDGGWGVAVAAAAEERHGQGAEEPLPQRPGPARRHRRSAAGEAGRAAGPCPGGPCRDPPRGTPRRWEPAGPRGCPRCGVNPRGAGGPRGSRGERAAPPRSCAGGEQLRLRGKTSPPCCMSALKSALP